MNEYKILIIEDDKSIQNLLKISLKANGYEYLVAENGLTGLSLFLCEHPNLILLDLGLPDVDGLEVLKQIKGNGNTPVIVVSARGQEREKVQALDLGADDYITKPFNVGELMARIRAALRHYKPKEPEKSTFQLADLKIDFSKRRVTVKQQEIHLTPLEYKMLVILVKNSGKVLTHKYIQKEVWGYGTSDDYQSLRVFMASIRRKIEEDTSNPKYIVTEVGVGYRFIEAETKIIEI